MAYFLPLLFQTVIYLYYVCIIHTFKHVAYIEQLAGFVTPSVSDFNTIQDVWSLH